ncbi:MAG: hypothetical protein UMU75_05540 [Halomonas sp.]|nr:hypothetical protein [Halomonas sp.]
MTTETLSTEEAARLAKEAFAPYECTVKNDEYADVLKVAVNVNDHLVDVTGLYRNVYSEKNLYIDKLNLARQRMEEIGASFEEWQPGAV